ncbi:MAG: T9SS type A sorting domain-containing protein [Bacteroidales bacterium]|nr:T9SS type A sorting domain-containing protein [Bacteroidales bacterium]
MKQRFTKLLAAVALLVGLAFPLGMWGQDPTITIGYGDSFNPAFPTSGGNSSTTAHVDETASNFAFKEQGIYKGAQNNYLMFVQNKGFLYNTEDLGTITSVAVTYSSGTSTSGKAGVYFGNVEQSTYTTTSNQTIKGQSQTDTWTNNTTGCGYFQFSTSNKNVQVTQIVITYTSGGGGPVQLDAPTLTATPGNEKVTLTWDNIAGTSSYSIQYADNSSFTGATTITNATSPKEVTELTNGTTYYFKAMSVGDGTNYISSDYGTAVSATPANIVTITITQDDIANFTNSYNWYDWTKGGISGRVFAYKNSGIQFNSDKTAYWIYNSSAIPGNITSVRMTKASGTDRTWTLKAGTSAITETSGGTLIGDEQTVGTSGATWNVSGSYNYFLLFVSGGSTVIGSIEISYTPSTDPSISAEDLSIDYDEISGSIEYSITNPANDGVLTPTVTDGGWLTLGQGTASPISFTCSANTAAARTATVTLTYTYDNNTKSVTKDVTVTQTGALMTVTYNANGGTGSAVVKNYEYGTDVTILNYNDENINFTAPSGKVFKNWNTATDATGNTYAAGATISGINTNYTLYAQWEDIPTYTLVTSIDQLVAGKHYLIASSEDEDMAYAMGYDKGNNRNAVAVAVESNTIEENEDVWDFVISGYTDNWTIYDRYTNGGYLYAASSSNNYLKTNANFSNLDDNYKWSIEIGEGGAATIVAQGSNTRKYMRYNKGSKVFSCYAEDSSVQDLVYLYVKNDDTDLEIYSPTTIASGKTVNCDTYTIGNTNGSLTIADGGQLIANNAVNATLQKEIVGFGDDNNVKTGWYTIASPVTSNITPAGDMLENTYDLYYYDEADFKWYNHKPNNAHSGFSIEPYKGYLYANSENTTLSFSGVMRASNVNVSIPLSYASSTENAKGFNLVGNPFTYNLTNSSNITLGGTSFSTYYVADGTVNNEGKNLIAYNIADRPIKPGEGFFVQATAADQSLVFNGRGRGEQNGYIRILAGNENFTDRAYVQFGGGNTLRKMTLSDNTAKVYVMQDNKDYAAAIIEKAQGEMPVNFKASANGTYTVTVNPEGVELNYLHLIDNMTGMDVDLLQTPSYTFDATTNDYASRFRLVFSANNVDGPSTGSEAFAFYSNGNWVVGNEGEATLQVIDVNGRIVSNETINGTVATSINATPGVYMLRLVNGNEVKTQKIVVK